MYGIFRVLHIEVAGKDLLGDQLWVLAENSLKEIEGHILNTTYPVYAEMILYVTKDADERPEEENILEPAISMALCEASDRLLQQLHEKMRKHVYDVHLQNMALDGFTDE